MPIHYPSSTLAPQGNAATEPPYVSNCNTNSLQDCTKRLPCCSVLPTHLYLRHLAVHVLVVHAVVLPAAIPAKALQQHCLTKVALLLRLTARTGCDLYHMP
jgi:hypothetical protein